MIQNRVQTDAFPLEPVLGRIEKEVEVFNEIYFHPKMAGVVNLFVPHSEKYFLHERLLYLKSNFGEFAHPEKANNLIRTLERMGRVMGFDEDGVVEQENPTEYGLDLSGLLPTQEGTPFFAWRLPTLLRWDVEAKSDIEEHQWTNTTAFPELKNSGIHRWMERSTYPIDDSSGDMDYWQDGVIHYSKHPDAMKVHALTIHKEWVWPGSDTRLSVHRGYVDNTFSNYSFHTKDGILVAVTVGKTETDVSTAFEAIQADLNVTPQHIRHYLVHSNLTDEHMYQLTDVMDALSKYPEMDVYELFPGQQPSLVSRIVEFLVGDALVKDQS